MKLMLIGIGIGALLNMLFNLEFKKEPKHGSPITKQHRKMFNL